jgi:hypothetical protein
VSRLQWPEIHHPCFPPVKAVPTQQEGALKRDWHLRVKDCGQFKPGFTCILCRLDRWFIIKLY